MSKETSTRFSVGTEALLAWIFRPFGSLATYPRAVTLPTLVNITMPRTFSIARARSPTGKPRGSSSSRTRSQR